MYHYILYPILAISATPCDIHSIPPLQLISSTGSIPRRLSFDEFGSITVKCQAGENLLFNSLNCTDGLWTGSASCGRALPTSPHPAYHDPTAYYRFSRPRSPSHLACDHSTDLLLDWRQLKADLAAVLASGRSMSVFVSRIQPQLVRFENFFRHHKDTRFTDCPLGYFAIRAYLTLIVYPNELEVQIAELAPHLAELVAEYPLDEVLASGWFSEIIAPILGSFRGLVPSSAARNSQEAGEALDALTAGDLETGDRKLKYWLGSLGFADEFFVETMLADVNIYEYLANIVVDRPNIPPVCEYRVCPQGQTWYASGCECVQVLPPVERASNICIFVSDSRPLGDLSEELENLRYWQLTFRVNALYADLQGYKIFFHQPQPSKERKIGWAKVLFMLQTMQQEGAACEFGVSIDSDAIFATNERLESAIAAYGLYRDRHFLFGEEYHQEEKADEVINANGGFFVVRNSEVGLQMLKEWYNVPNTYPTHRQYAKDNPQGLNFCWDSKIHHKYKQYISYAHPQLFSAPYSLMVRHNWFKDEAFEAELTRIALERIALNDQVLQFD